MPPNRGLGPDLQLVPFLDEAPMQGAPSCTKADLTTPKLRRCTFDLDTIDWDKAELLGCGSDGPIWKVKFGEDDANYVVKVFWQAEPSKREPYFAAQRECQNNATIQIMEAAVADSVATQKPIFIDPSPAKDYNAAMANMMAFSDEHRQIGQQFAESMVVDQIPRMITCYGWARFDGKVVNKMPQRVQPQPWKRHGHERKLDEDGNYIAIVYEYMENGTSGLTHVRDVMWFLFRVGFCIVIFPQSQNWRRGVLVDMSDLIHPNSPCWNFKGYVARCDRDGKPLES